MKLCSGYDQKYRSCVLIWLSRLLPPVDANFFLAGIAPGFAGVGDPSGPCFLNPGTHFILVLVEPVATKDLAPGESPWCRLHEPLPNLWIICSLSMPPGCLQRVAWIMNPWWAGDVIAFAQELDGGGAKSAPAVGKLGILVSCAGFASGSLTNAARLSLA